jgi:uncharacterized membrane protein HdeD (DUF308 family)
MDGVTVKGIAQKSIGWSIAFSVLLIVVGLLAIAAPLVAGVAVTSIVGWLIVLGGVMHLVFAWHVRAAGDYVWELLVGVLYLVVGEFVLWHPLAGLVGLTLVLGCYLLAKGIFELVLGFRLRPVPGSGWLLVDAVISLVLAGMIWWHLPSAAAWVVGTLVGFGILFSGISRLALSLAAKRVVA